MTSYACFRTSFGDAAIAWGDDGIVAVAFPAASTQARRRILRHTPDAEEAPPTAEIATVIDDIAALFRGERRDLMSARLDLTAVGDFERRVFDATRRVPPGQTRTYGDIARALGDLALAQRIGQALGANPFPVIVPCHRVIGADGRMTGFSAPGGTAAKMRLLKLEGALAPDLFDAADRKQAGA